MGIGLALSAAEGAATGTLGEVITNVTQVATAAYGWAGQAIEVVTSHPLLLMGCVVPFVGLGVGLLKRFLRV